MDDMAMGAAERDFLRAACDAMALGAPARMERVGGGFLHSMYRVETPCGGFGIKRLNPEIMARPGARDNMLRSERIARVALAAGVPALPARMFDGSPLVAVMDGQCMCFDWISGTTVARPDAAHARAMGRALGRLHAADIAWDGPAVQPEGAPDVDGLTCAQSLPEARALDELRARLDPLARDMAAARADMRADIVSHRDADPKNVIWRGATPTLIDWEAAGPIDARYDLLETALYWTPWAAGRAEEQLGEFTRGYREGGGTARLCGGLYGAVLAGKLDWLSYNARRAGSDDAGERARGRSQLLWALNDVNAFVDARDGILAAMDGLGE